MIFWTAGGFHGKADECVLGGFSQGMSFGDSLDVFMRLKCVLGGFSQEFSHLVVGVGVGD